MSYEEKGLKKWKVITLIGMDKISNFFSTAGFSLASLYSFASLLPLYHSFARRFTQWYTLTRSLSPLFLSFLIHSHVLSTIFIHALPFFLFFLKPCFIYIPIARSFIPFLSTCFIYTTAWPGTGSRSEGTWIVSLQLCVIVTRFVSMTK